MNTQQAVFTADNTILTEWRKNDDFMGAVQLHNIPLTAGIFWSGKTDSLHKCVCDYEIYYDGVLLFKSAEGDGKEIHLSPFDAPDSPGAIFSILGFMSLRPGDTDDDYFTDYTPEQMAFAKSIHADDLSTEVSDFEEGISTHFTYLLRA